MKLFAPLGIAPVDKKVGNGPAKEFRLPGARGTIGFISPLGESFCQNCNRLRLTADGNLRPCLLSDIEVPLLPTLRAGEPVLPLIQKAVALKPEGHELQQHVSPYNRCMMQIGG
jgi:cyclic pyranopterin phosphate synthase